MMSRRMTALIVGSALVLSTRAVGDDSRVEAHIVMSHSTPAHRELACLECHARAESSGHAADDLMPNEKTCARCHAADVRPATPSASTCGKCHQPLGSRGVPVARLQRPPPDLHFSHRAHLLRGTACARCHGDARGQPVLPSMEKCLECHRAQQANSCRGCHVAEPTGRLKTRRAGSPLKPLGPLMGMAHDTDWMVRHRWVGADRGEVCATCHEERDCVRCHDGRMRPRTIHPGDYLRLHSQDARRGTTRCQSCHSVQSFCGECHSRMGLANFAPRELRTSKAVHPPASVWSRGATRHAAEARRGLANCTSCHAEQDCIACHGARGVGGMAVSPHPPGFERGCGAAIAANSRACVTCHGSLAQVRDRCR